MNCDQILNAITDDFIKGTVISPTEGGCKVALSLLEPSGDAVNIYIEEALTGFMIHDGGHIRGILFQAGPAGASPSDKRAINNLIADTGLKSDSDTGRVFAQADDHNLVYWVMEIARTISVGAAMIPTSTPRSWRNRRLGPRIASAITKRLVTEGLMGAIHPGTNIRGITEQERYVDLSYTIPKNRIGVAVDTTVLILTLDLDVNNPIAKANSGLAVATDLVGAAREDHAVNVRLVHSVGSANGNAERARRLIKVVADKHLLQDYSWDDPEDQGRFITTVGQELAPFVGTP